MPRRSARPSHGSSDHDLSSRLVAAGLARSRDFAIENTVAGTIAVYKKLLEPRPT